MEDSDSDSENVRKIDEIIKNHKKIKVQDPDEIEFEYKNCTQIEFEYNYDNTNGEEDEMEEYEIPNFTKSDITKFKTYVPSQFLADEENEIVNACTDPSLKELLILNRKKNVQLMQVYTKIKVLLMGIQESIATSEEKLKMSMSVKLAYPKVWRLGIPYFKTADDFPCPRNDDIIRKHNNGEILCYDMTATARWSERDMNRLLKAVAFQHKAHKESELEKQIQEKKRKMKKTKKKPSAHNDDEEIQALSNKLEDLKNGELDQYPPMGCEDYIDWNRLSSNYFRERYTGQDCEICWKICLHPDLNKKEWSSEEDIKLMTLATANDYQNWDLIAEELGTNRTPLSTCIHYWNKLDPPRTGRFSPAEDKKILDLIQIYRQGEYIPFTKISQYFPTRTRSQIFYRYKYFLAVKDKTLRGKFSEAEDILILVLVDRFGRKFTKCGEYFPHRSVVQIKARYTSNLKGALKKGSFTIEEDNVILDYVKKNGVNKFGLNSWMPLVPLLNRCSGQIMQRYKTLKGFLEDNPTLGLAQAPRRRFHGVSFDAEFEYLRLMADRFLNCEKIPTLEDIERLLMSNPKPQAKPLKPLPRSKNLRLHKEVANCSEDNGGEMPKKKSRQRGKKHEPSKGTSEDTDNNQESKTSTDNKCSSPQSEDSGDDQCGTLPSLAVDDLLTGFFCNTMKIQVEQNLKEDRLLRTTASGIANVLSILQAELYIPKNCSQDKRLDSIDRDILQVLTEDRPITIDDEFVIKRDSLYIDRMIPPNLNTMVGLRSLLIKNQMYKSKCAKRAGVFEGFRKDHMEKQVLWCINNHLSGQSKETRNEMISERNLFLKRFMSLFKFPAIMSLVEPSAFLLAHTYTPKRRDIPSGVRTYQKRPKPKPIIPDKPGAFEEVFVKRFHEEEDYNTTTSTTAATNLVHTQQETPFYFGTIKRDDVSSKTSLDPLQDSHPALRPASEGVEVKSEKEPPALKLSMVDQLKRRISQTIRDLTQSPPTKKFFHGVDILKLEEVSDDEPTLEATGVKSRNNIARVIENNVQTNRGRKRVSKAKVPDVIPVVKRPTAVPVRSYGSKAKLNTITTASAVEINAPTPLRAYVPKAKLNRVTESATTIVENAMKTCVPEAKKKAQQRVTASETAEITTAPTAYVPKAKTIVEKAMNTTVPRAKKRAQKRVTSTPGPSNISNTSSMASIKIKDLCSMQATVDTQSNFDLSKGELILEGDSPNGSSCSKDLQDLQDVHMLDAILKKEKDDTDNVFDF